MYPENWPTIQLFLAADSEWRFGAMGGVMGLNMEAVDIVIKYRQIEVTPRMFEGLQLMGRVITPLLNQKDE